MSFEWNEGSLAEVDHVGVLFIHNLFGIYFYKVMKICTNLYKTILFIQLFFLLQYTPWRYFLYRII